MSDNEIEILNTKEAAELLRLSPSAVHKLRKEGQIPFVKLGKKIFFKKESLVDYVNKQLHVYE